MYLIPPCLTLGNIRYVSWVNWSNPGKRVAPSPTPQCSSYWKGSLWLLSTTVANYTNLYTQIYGFKYSCLIKTICTQLYGFKYSCLIKAICTQLYGFTYSCRTQIIWIQLYGLKYSFQIQIIYAQLKVFMYSCLYTVIWFQVCTPIIITQFAGAVEYTDCIYAEG